MAGKWKVTSQAQNPPAYLVSDGIKLMLFLLDEYYYDSYYNRWQLKFQEHLVSAVWDLIIAHGGSSSLRMGIDLPKLISAIN